MRWYLLATQEIQLQNDFITLGQLLKDVGAISTGGQAKWFLQETAVQVDGSPEDRRGRKLYPGMRVVIPDVGTIVLVEGHHVS